MAFEALFFPPRRPSEVSLYQQQKRISLTIPHLNNETENEANTNNGRSNIMKRRSAVHGLSPMTGMSIGVVM